jgi:hypothetical protein
VTETLSQTRFLIPIFTAIVTAALTATLTYYISERSYSLQRFATATTITTNEIAQQNAELKKWADAVIRDYIAGQNSETATSLPSNAYVVTDLIVDNVCLVPKEMLEPTQLHLLPIPPNALMDKMQHNLGEPFDQNPRLLLFKALAEYQSLESYNSALLSLLHKTCGFLKTRKLG